MCLLQIFGSEVGQAEVFDGTVRSPVQDFLQGKNSLLFSYGVTNAGKTHTIQGKMEIGFSVKCPIRHIVFA